MFHKLKYEKHTYKDFVPVITGNIMPEYLGKDVRKIIRVGGSAAVTLPKEYLEAHSLKLGDKMELNFNHILNIEPVNRAEIRKKLGKEGAR